MCICFLIIQMGIYCISVINATETLSKYMCSGILITDKGVTVFCQFLSSHTSGLASGSHES